jgi:Mor family transcriptional regulator
MKKDSAQYRLCEIAAEAAVETLMKGMPTLIEKIVLHVLDAYAGERIPKGTATRRLIRNQHIREQAAAGHDVEILAMAFKLSKSQIKRILKQHGKSESD